MWSEHAFIFLAALGGAATFGAILEQDVRDKAMGRPNVLGKNPPHPVWALFLYCMILVMLSGSALIEGGRTVIVLASVCVTLTGACVVHHSFLVPIHQTIRMAAGDIPGGPVYRFSNAVGLMMMLFGMPVMMMTGLPLLREILR